MEEPEEGVKAATTAGGGGRAQAIKAVSIVLLMESDTKDRSDPTVDIPAHRVVRGFAMSRSH